MTGISASSEWKEDKQAVNYNNLGFSVGVFAMTGMRVSYHDTIDVVYMGKHRNACLIHGK